MYQINPRMAGLAMIRITAARLVIVRREALVALVALEDMATMDWSDCGIAFPFDDWHMRHAGSHGRILAVCGDGLRASPAPRRTGSDARSRATRTDAAPCRCRRGR